MAHRTAWPGVPPPDLPMMVEGGLEFNEPWVGNRILEWQDLAGPIAADLILAVNPEKKVSQTRPHQRTSRAPRGRIFTVDHESVAPALVKSREELARIAQ